MHLWGFGVLLLIDQVRAPVEKLVLWVFLDHPTLFELFCSTTSRLSPSKGRVCKITFECFILVEHFPPMPHPFGSLCTKHGMSSRRTSSPSLRQISLITMHCQYGLHLLYSRIFCRLAARLKVSASYMIVEPKPVVTLLLEIALCKGLVAI